MHFKAVLPNLYSKIYIVKNCDLWLCPGGPWTHTQSHSVLAFCPRGLARCQGRSSGPQAVQGWDRLNPEWSELHIHQLRIYSLPVAPRQWTWAFGTDSRATIWHLPWPKAAKIWVLNSITRPQGCFPSSSCEASRTFPKRSCSLALKLSPAEQWEGTVLSDSAQLPAPWHEAAGPST